MPHKAVSSILDYFTPQMQKTDGSVRMLDLQNELRNRLYILNAQGKKLLQISVKDEPNKNLDAGIHAQLKIIPYGLRKAQVWRNQPNDPQNIRLSNTFEYELTYHGSGNEYQTPKIHLIERRSGQKEYKTLIDTSLPLSKDTFRFVPLFSLNSGHASTATTEDSIKKKAHVFKIESSKTTQLDFYLSGSDSSIELAFNTHHGLSLFFSLDYLCSQKNGILRPVTIAMPITGFRMGNYRLWVRCSLSDYAGRPMMQFYQNAAYYESFADRPMAWSDGQGGLAWSTVAAEDTRTLQQAKEATSRK